MSPIPAGSTPLETLYHRVHSINTLLGAEKPDISRKARWFAHLIAMFWIYFSIGHWYGSRFVASESRPEVTFLFGAVFVVWFAAFWGYLGVRLTTRKRRA